MRVFLANTRAAEVGFSPGLKGSLKKLRTQYEHKLPFILSIIK